MFPATKPQQCDSAASLTSNVDAEAVNTTRFEVQNQDVDHNPQFTVCRVCLAMSVKMYHLSEHKLSVMYERVTGVEMNSEDKLPKMLCWECVARLSFANNFIEKALKTHWILLKKIIGNDITMSDIESIDRAQYQLESKLGFKYFEANNTDLHIQRESDNFELLTNNYEHNELIQPDEKCSIKNELFDVTEQQEADLQVPQSIISIKENLSDEEVLSNAGQMSEEENHTVLKHRKLSEAIKQERIDFSVTPLSDWSKGLPDKELRVVLEDVMLSLRKQNTQDSSKEVTNNSVFYIKAQSIKNKETVTCPTINKGTLTNNNLDIICTSTVEALGLENLPSSNPKHTNDTACGRTGTVSNNIDHAHHDAESSKKILICDMCNHSFQNKSFLKRHIEGLYNCTYCTYKTCRKEYLIKHVKTKHTKQNSFNCSYCSYKSYYKSSLIRHINCIHTKSTVYNCSYCIFKTYDKSALNYHVNATHTKNTVFNCSHCDYKTYNKSTLKNHVNATHTKNTVFDCSHCNYTTYNRSHLNNHVNATHNRNTLFDCSHCGYKTYNRSNFNHHVNVKHSKNVVFDCSYCDYKSYDKSNLTKHINFKHTKHTVYNCSYCCYKTYNNSCFNRHINCVHGKNIVFNCAHCGYEAFTKSNLGKHIRIKHNN